MCSLLVCFFAAPAAACCYSLFANERFANGAGGGAATSPTPRFVFTPCRLVFKNPEPVIKVFANGGALRPPQPPRFFFAPCSLAFKKIAPSTRLASQTRSCYGVFFFKLSHHTGSLFANEGFANGGGGLQHPPTPLLFLRHAGWFSRTSEPVIPVFAKWEGCTPPVCNPPPFFSTPCKLAFQNTEPVIKGFDLQIPLRTRDKNVFAKGAGALTTPRFFLRYAGWLSRTQKM